MSELNKIDRFKELLDMTHKGYIDNKYIQANRQPPVPKSLVPLAYEDERVQKGLDQLRVGALNAINALNKYMGNS